MFSFDMLPLQEDAAIFSAREVYFQRHTLLRAPITPLVEPLPFDYVTALLLLPPLRCRYAAA